MERIIQIINHIIVEFLSHENSTCSKRSLTRELLQLGFDSQDIDTAFKSLLTLPLFLNDDLQDEILEIKHGQRIFSPAEQKKLSMAFQREIVRLANHCLLSLAEVERVLLEAMQLENAEVGIKELEQILHKVVKEEERILLMLPYKADTAVAFLLN